MGEGVVKEKNRMTVGLCLCFYVYQPIESHNDRSYCISTSETNDLRCISKWWRVCVSRNWVIIGSGMGCCHLVAMSRPEPMWTTHEAHANAMSFSVQSYLSMVGMHLKLSSAKFWPFSSRVTWRGHEMDTFSALLPLCAGNSPVTGELPSQRPVMRGFDVFLDLRLNKRLSKQSRRRWFEMPSRSLWCHCNDSIIFSVWEHTSVVTAPIGVGYFTDESISTGDNKIPFNAISPMWKAELVNILEVVHQGCHLNHEGITKSNHRHLNKEMHVCRERKYAMNEITKQCEGIDSGNSL